MNCNPLSPTKWTAHPHTMVRWGGGGNKEATKTTGVPDYLQPYIENAAGSATDIYNSGDMSAVAGLTPEQKDAYQRKLELGKRGGMLDSLAADSYGAAGVYRDAAAGTGMYGEDALGKQITAMKETIGSAQQEQLGGLMGQASMGGGLGSARGDAMTGAALSKTGADIATGELAARRAGAMTGAGGVINSGSTIGGQLGAGVAATEGVGGALQQQNQNEADAAYQGISRLFGLYGAPAMGSKTVTNSSGGK